MNCCLAELRRDLVLALIENAGHVLSLGLELLQLVHGHLPRRLCCFVRELQILECQHFSVILHLNIFELGLKLCHVLGQFGIFSRLTLAFMLRGLDHEVTEFGVQLLVLPFKVFVSALQLVRHFTGLSCLLVSLEQLQVQILVFGLELVSVLLCLAASNIRLPEFQRIFSVEAARLVQLIIGELELCFESAIGVLTFFQHVAEDGNIFTVCTLAFEILIRTLFHPI